jgi:hypothetical protein
VANDPGLNSTKIKKSILASKKVKVWFWDTVREYTGEAVSLSATELTALLKLGGTGMATVIPSPSVMEGLIRHLTRRVVEFRIVGMGLEVNLKGTIREVQRDFENAKRLLLVATLQASSDRNQLMLHRLGKNLGG